jgi:hypothetical protein
MTHAMRNARCRIWGLFNNIQVRAKSAAAVPRHTFRSGFPHIDSHLAVPAAFRSAPILKHSAEPGYQLRIGTGLRKPPASNEKTRLRAAENAALTSYFLPFDARIDTFLQTPVLPDRCSFRSAERKSNIVGVRLPADR